MFVVQDPEDQCRWWAEKMVGVLAQNEGPFWCVEGEDGVEVGFHPADTEHNPWGRTPVVYWKSCGSVDDRLKELIAAGCTHHRGPLDVEPGRRICLLIDSFGNCFGLDEL